MSNLTDELRRLRKDDSDVALVLGVYEEIERVYGDTLEAMGVISKPIPEVKNSAEVTISFRSTPLSTGD